MGVTSILVTHDREEAFDIADKVVVFNRCASVPIPCLPWRQACALVMCVTSLEDYCATKRLWGSNQVKSIRRQGISKLTMHCLICVGSHLEWKRGGPDNGSLKKEWAG